MKKLVAFLCALWLTFATVSSHSAEKIEVTDVYNCESGEVYTAIVKKIQEDAVLIGIGRLHGSLVSDPVLYFAVDLKSMEIVAVFEKRPGQPVKQYTLDEFAVQNPTLCSYFDQEKV